MHNSDNDPLVLPIVGQDPLVLGENKILVAATVAAVVLAGSAIAYRHAANISSKDRPRNGLSLKASSGLEGHFDVKHNGERAIDSEAGLPTASTSTTSPCTLGQEVGIAVGTCTSPTKNPRSKDRRRRGKDPLKEALKGGKKLKTIAPTGSPAPPNNTAAPSSSLVSTDFEEESLVSAGPSSSFQSLEPGFSSAPTHAQSVIPSLDPSSQPCPRKRRQHPKSTATTSTTPSADATILSVSGHSKTSSETSHSILEAEDEDEALVIEEVDEVPITPNYKQSAHRSYPSQSSTNTSHSFSSAPSSVTDASELEMEARGWITSVSKSRSRNRTRLADVVFEDASVNGNHDKCDKCEQATASGRRGKARAEHFTAEVSLTPVPPVDLVEDTLVSQHDAEPVDVPPPPSPPSVRPDAMTDSLNGPDGISSLERDKNKAGGAQTQQQDQQEPSPWVWDGTAAGPGPASVSSNSNAHPTQIDEEVSNPDLNSGEKNDEVTFHTKSQKLQVKGTSGRTNYSSFSSALLEGGGGVGVGKCRTVAVSVAGPSGSASTGVAVGVEAMDDSGLVSFGLEDGDKEEFTFPTLNPLPSAVAGGSNRTQSALNDSTVNSSPSKRTKKSGKSSALSPNAISSPTSSPSKSSSRYITPGYGNASNVDGVIAAQTQLASLKGALEAARQREEKHKEEMEKAMKDMELLKWESTNSRRGEAELQAQVRHLMDQLQSYATLFANMTPHLGPQLPAAHYLQQTQPPQQMKEEQVNNDNLSDPESISPMADPSLPLPNGDEVEIASERPSTPQLEEEPNKAAQEESVSSLTADEAPILPSTPSQSQSQNPPPLPLSLSPPLPQMSGVHEARYVMSPPPSAAVPSPFFPYAMPPYVQVHHPHLPVQPSFPWMASPYQRQQAQTAHGVPIMFPPTMYPMSPVPPPLSPPGVGQMPSPRLFHQHQPFGYSNGSAGTSSAGSYSPELSGSPGLGMNGKHRPRMKKKKPNLVNGNARAGWEDVGDSWIGLNGVASQTAASGERKRKKETCKVPSSDPEVDDDDDDDASGPYSDLLADAILKRPSSILSPSVAPLQKKVSTTARKENEVSEGRKHEKYNHEEPAQEVDQLTEFTFPSLSDFAGGGPYYRAASRTESSISSSLSSSPPSTIVTVPDSVGDPKWEEDRSSLPPVVENAEDLAVASS